MEGLTGDVHGEEALFGGGGGWGPADGGLHGWLFLIFLCLFPPLPLRFLPAPYFLRVTPQGERTADHGECDATVDRSGWSGLDVMRRRGSGGRSLEGSGTRAADNSSAETHVDQQFATE